MSQSIVPRLYIQSKGEESTKLPLMLTQARRKVVVRFTGGCGFMSMEDGRGVIDLFTKAFRGFKGAMLFGGTRAIRRDDTRVIIPMITEVPPAIRAQNDGSVALGVVPKTAELSLTAHGMVVSNEKENDYITIVHPNQDVCLVVQQSVDTGVDWEAEYHACIAMTHNLRTYAGFESLLVSYNGGSITEKEIVATAQRGWPVLLIKGSGRITDTFVQNQHFLDQYPNVCVTEKTSESIRDQLIRLQVIRQTNEVEGETHGVTRETVHRDSARR